MEAIGASEPRVTSGSRRWPLPVFLAGLLSVGASYALVLFLQERIVRLGPLDAVVVAALLVTAFIWCVAASFMGATASAAKGRVAEFLHLAVLVPATVLVGLAMTVFMNLGLLLAAGESPQVRLDVPEGSPGYIVVPFTFGETTLTLYRGNGVVFKRLGTSLPLPDSPSEFTDSYEVRRGAGGRLHLTYRQHDGKEANVVLP